MRTDNTRTQRPATSQTAAAPPDSAWGKRLDRVGATASLACAIHCALLPLVLTLLPLFGLAFLADQRIEWALVAGSGILGVTSLCLGYREHGSRRALAVLAVGLGLLATGRIAETQQAGFWGVVVVVLGGVTVATSHLLNRRLCNSCRACNHSHD